MTRFYRRKLINESTEIAAKVRTNMADNIVDFEYTNSMGDTVVAKGTTNFDIISELGGVLPKGVRKPNPELLNYWDVIARNWRNCREENITAYNGISKKPVDYEKIEGWIRDLKKQLEKGEATFTFIKKDGTRRDAHGTRNPEIIKQNGGDIEGIENEKENILTYFDLDKKEWRNCRYYSLISYIDRNGNLVEGRNLKKKNTLKEHMSDAEFYRMHAEDPNLSDVWKEKASRLDDAAEETENFDWKNSYENNPSTVEESKKMNKKGMLKESDDLMEKIKEKMKDGVVSFTFIKKDGSKREARGTRNIDRVKELGGTVPTGTGTEKKGVLAFYDLDKKDWRCCREGSIVEINECRSVQSVMKECKMGVFAKPIKKEAFDIGEFEYEAGYGPYVNKKETPDEWMQNLKKELEDQHRNMEKDEVIEESTDDDNLVDELFKGRKSVSGQEAIDFFTKKGMLESKSKKKKTLKESTDDSIKLQVLSEVEDMFKKILEENADELSYKWLEMTPEAFGGDPEKLSPKVFYMVYQVIKKLALENKDLFESAIEKIFTFKPNDGEEEGF